MKINELGEFGLIERIAALVGPPGKDVLLGIGDDAAAVRTGAITVLTTDMLVENVHFTKEFPPHALGYKAMAANISDVAAVAGTPKYALVSLALASQTSVDYIDELYRGLIDCAKKYQVEIVGGDITEAPQLALNVALVGMAESASLRRRNLGQAGDIVLITGSLGGAAAGLEILKKGKSSSDNNPLVKAHFYPPARVQEASAAAAAGCRAMEDISDGLGLDLANICRASDTGAKVIAEKIPLYRGLKEAAAALEMDPVELAISGGEDYELILTASRESAGTVAENVYRETGTPVTAIGEITAGERVHFLKSDGSEYYPKKNGYEHFR